MSFREFHLLRPHSQVGRVILAIAASVFAAFLLVAWAPAWAPATRA